MAQADYGIEIRRSGQHPYMPGAVRLSTLIFVLLWWLAGAIFTMQAIEPTGRNLLSALVILCLGTGALLGAGYLMAKDNPFHQEIVLRSVVRALRNRNNLET